MKTTKQKVKESYKGLKDKLGIENAMQAPKILKVSISSGVGSLSDKKKIDLLNRRVQGLFFQNEAKEKKNTELENTVNALKERTIEEHMVYASSAIGDNYKGQEYFTPNYVANRFWLKLEQKSDVSKKSDDTYFYLDDRLRPILVRKTDLRLLEAYQSTKFLFTGTNSQIFFKGSLESSVFNELDINIFDKIWTIDDMQKFFPYLHSTIGLIIMMSAYAITNLVLNAVSGDALNNP